MHKIPFFEVSSVFSEALFTFFARKGLQMSFSRTRSKCRQFRSIPCQIFEVMDDAPVPDGILRSQTISSLNPLAKSFLARRIMGVA